MLAFLKATNNLLRVIALILFVGRKLLPRDQATLHWLTPELVALLQSNHVSYGIWVLKINKCMYRNLAYAMNNCMDKNLNCEPD